MSKPTPNPEQGAVSRRRSFVIWPLAAGALAVFLISLSSSMAGEFENGVAAYNRLDSTTAWRLLRPLAERGDAGAQALVGNMYARGLGITYDGAEAVRWWRKAAEQGDTGAEEELATAYFFGDGVQADHSEAARWFRRAAERGEIFAQTCLASLYERGEGVPKDLALAHMWLSLAAAQGQPVAKIGLDKLASKMTSGQVSEARRLARGGSRRNSADPHQTAMRVTSKHVRAAGAPVTRRGSVCLLSIFYLAILCAPATDDAQAGRVFSAAGLRVLTPARGLLSPLSAGAWGLDLGLGQPQPLANSGTTFDADARTVLRMVCRRRNAIVAPSKSQSVSVGNVSKSLRIAKPPHIRPMLLSEIGSLICSGETFDGEGCSAGCG
jgi:hypothetical protein